MSSSLGLKQAVQRDAAGNVKGVSLPGFEVAFERDALGLEVSRQLPGGVVVRQDRDDVGRLLWQKVHRGPVELEKLEYQWGFDFRLLGTSDSAGAQRFQHDGRGRLISARMPDGRVQHRAMDGLGNLFRRPDKTDRKYGPGGRLDEAEGVKYVHDEDGQLVAKLQKDGGQWHYHYDASGQLVSVKRPDGKEVHYRYDALGRRVEKTFAGKRTAWVWDGDVPVHEVVSSLGDEAATPSPAATTWVFEPESFTPLAKLQGQEAYAAVANHLGTPVALYDGKGKLAWKQQLDTYGEAKATKVSTDCQWRWPGQYEDEETGLYYNRFRYYDPKAGRYITQDPIRIEGGLNFYGYVADSSTWSDPFGLSGCPPRDVHTNASEQRVWGPHNGPGPLGPEVAKTFRSATYVETTLTEEIVLYRVYGGKAKQLGPYWTRTKPIGPLQSKMDSAILPEWGNTASEVASMRVPAGKTIYEGVAAPQTGARGGPSLLGGGDQVYIPRVDPNWLVKP